VTVQGQNLYMLLHQSEILKSKMRKKVLGIKRWNWFKYLRDLVELCRRC